MIDYSKHTILIVDDELEVLNSLKRGLHSEPYDKIFAKSGAEAIEVFARNEEISLIVTDMRMPGMDGLELLRLSDEFSPRTVKIVLTGYMQLPQILATVNHLDIFKFLTKPWDLETELKVFIREGIERYEKSLISDNKLKSVENKSNIYNKMLTDSYEKADQQVKLYEELLKSVNQHHIMSIQELRGLNISDENQEKVSEAIRNMNDRVHYINKIFEFGKYSMKTFDLFDLKEVLNKNLKRINLTVINIEIGKVDDTLIYYDNFKMISGVMIDILELIQTNDALVTHISIAAENIENQSLLIYEVKCLPSDKLSMAITTHGKFVQGIIQNFGGRFNKVDEEDLMIFEFRLPLKIKDLDSLKFFK